MSRDGSCVINQIAHVRSTGMLNIQLPFTAAGFGLRVVGGKTGADGRTFAYVMWTVPDGPAAKAGIQRGDKVRKIEIFFPRRNAFA